ncbi:ABC-type nitrate/sulfonate/bicarbonate transport system, permease component [Longilinea arvoryzae]|uniref:ABC-type nitrate/sulfonate/bicarbonate transport system, permease component n=1 Tax=Longilinea arvoryzae TaxID=360412 RepID=A0A0S7BGN3_9CHLR|nr:ABC transporter permease [Longilinea arvoryzae]GAP12977.1 ABC-type nitrate/sulfonate/bicarbonate transport system, permease component [Longilinea arvoryzae]
MDLSLKRDYKSTTPRLIQRHSGWVAPVSVLVVLGAWEAVARWGGLPAFILPSPELVLQKLAQTLADGTLERHTLVTLGEVLAGLATGGILAMALGYWLSRSPLVEKILSPYLVASQAVPVAAIAPLLIIWFPGVTAKVLICALTVFFPVLINTLVGMRAVPENLRDLMRSLHATPSQMLRYLELPAALPVLLGGLRVGATLSVIGAVVGEFVSSDRGLGFLINIGRGQFDTALVFVAIFALMVMAMSLYGIIVLLEKRLLKWRS